MKQLIILALVLVLGISVYAQKEPNITLNSDGFIIYDISNDTAKKLGFNGENNVIWVWNKEIATYNPKTGGIISFDIFDDYYEKAVGHIVKATDKNSYQYIIMYHIGVENPWLKILILNQEMSWDYNITKVSLWNS